MCVKNGRWLASLAMLLILGVGLNGFAQFTSNVQGTVTDNSGALVEGAQVVLNDIDTNVSYKYATNDSGQYRFLRLALGNYTITASHPGFRDAQVTIRLTAEETAGANLVLNVANATQQITVTSEAPALNPEETRLQYTLEASDLAELPSQNHGSLNFIRLAPGVTGIAENISDIQPNRNLADAASNGLSNASNLYTLDGVPIVSQIQYDSAYNGSHGGAVSFTPNVDALAEVALQTTTFNVSYGSAASLQVALATKSGANKFHGAADYTYHDKILDSNGYLQPNNVANHNMLYSAVLGGPIFKDKTFFFGAFEHFGQYGAASGTTVWYSQQFQDFIQAADPNSVNVQKFILANPATRAIPDGRNIKTAGQIFGTTDSQRNCAASFTIPFGIPCGMVVTQESVAAAPFSLDGKNWNVRLDQYLHNNRDRIFVYYFSLDQTSTSLSSHPTWDGSTPSQGKQFTTNYTHTFSPNLLNTATFGYNFFKFDFTDTAHSSNLLLVPFITQIFDAGGIDGFTRFTPFGNQERQLYGRDSVLWIKGKHSLDIGFEASNNYATNVNNVFSRPFINQYYSTSDFLNDKLDGELLISHYDGLTGAYRPFQGNAVNTRFGIYAQDSWKFRPRLTLNYGVRWDDLGNPTPYQGSIPWANTFFTGSDFKNIASSIATRPVNSVFESRRNLNFLPRGGFAWNPSATNSSTLIRGGIGLYQDSTALELIANSVTSLPPTGALTAFFGPDKAILSYGSDPSKAPYGFTFPAFGGGSYNSDGSPVGSAASISGLDRNLKPSRSILWNMAISHELPAQMVLGITYGGSHSYNLPYNPDVNLPSGNNYCGNNPALLPNTPQCDFSTAAKTPTPHPLNSHWNSISPTMAGEHSNYSALIAQLTQRWRTLNWQTSYTWSHTLADKIAADQYKLVYTNADFDVNQRFTASYAYGIPTPSVGNSLLRQTVGGWNLNGVVILQTGVPFTVAWNDLTHDFTGSGGFGSYYAIPDYTGGIRGGWSKKQIKAGIFGDPNDPTFAAKISSLFPNPRCGACNGSAGVNQFRNPGYATWDQAIVKKISLPWFQGEKSTLSIRGQAFNVLNRVNFTRANSNLTGGAVGSGFTSNQARVLEVGGRFEF